MTFFSPFNIKQETGNAAQSLANNTTELLTIDNKLIMIIFALHF